MRTSFNAMEKPFGIVSMCSDLHSHAYIDEDSPIYEKRTRCNRLARPSGFSHRKHVTVAGAALLAFGGFVAVDEVRLFYGLQTFHLLRHGAAFACVRLERDGLAGDERLLDSF